MLSATSWDTTQARMAGLIAEVLGERAAGQCAGAAGGRGMTAALRARKAARRYDYLIVGAGFAGSVLAERLASQHGARVLLIDRRPHVGGNAYDEQNEAGILYHKYGPHIFHTNSDAGRRLSVAVHRVAAVRASRAGRGARPAGADPDQPHDAQHAVRRSTSRPTRKRPPISPRAPSRSRTSGRPRTWSSTPSARELYELFFRGYTRKQWGLDPSRARQVRSPSRIPTRTNTDDRYFTDTFQAMPSDGYTRDVRADARPSADRDAHSASTSATSRDEVDADHIIYTGPIDEYFDFRFGKLPYRSLKFDHQTLDQEQFQPVAVRSTIRRQDVPYTRISEYKHLTGQEHPQTTHHLRISVGRGRSLLPDPAAGEPGAVQALRGAGRRDRGRHLRRPAGDLPLLQHGPDRRPGAGDVPADGREATTGAAAGTAAAAAAA